MKTALLIFALVLFAGCASPPKLDDKGQPPAGWQVVPKPPVPF